MSKRKIQVSHKKQKTAILARELQNYLEQFSLKFTANRPNHCAVSFYHHLLEPAMYAIFLDIETTGLDPYRHWPIDLAFQIMDLQKEAVVAKYQENIYCPKEIWDQRDPLSIEINGYRYQELKEGKNKQVVFEEVVNLFTQLEIQRGYAFFICQNPAFDRPFFDQIVPVYTQEELNWPYHWLDLASMYWGALMRGNKQREAAVPKQINLSKDAIGKKFGIPEEPKPHRAMNGVEHLMRCYNAVIHK